MRAAPPSPSRRDPDWRDDAACRPDPDAMFESSEAGIANARHVCARCPVKRACLVDAIRTDDNDHGVRAGLLPRERKAVAKEVARREAAKAAV